MAEEIKYYKVNDRIEGVYYVDCKKTYPVHTHTSHAIIGNVTDGAIQITEGNNIYIYRAGEHFHLMPNIAHAIAPFGKNGEGFYSMICLCIKAENMNHVYKELNNYTEQLQKMMLDSPEEPFSIEDMAKSVCISPFHMIRQFKIAYGLTPHQFQMQSRIRKAQKLLESGTSITEAAYATGFYDQSHFIRCFKKIVGMIPSDYVHSIWHD